MAIITDLTWRQLQTASGITDLIITDTNNGLIINLRRLTGTLSTNIDSNGVVQAMYKLREFCAIAQTVVNTNQNIGERLASFPPSQSGTAINGYVVSTGAIITQTPLSTTGILGASN